MRATFLMLLVGCGGPASQAPAEVDVEVDAKAPEAEASTPIEGRPSGGPECPPDLPPDYDPSSGWPKDPTQLVAHLNRWDRDELELVAQPDAHPDRISSGETGGWVHTHLEQLRALGVEVAWNAADRCYGEVSDRR